MTQPNVAEPSHARERRWQADFRINVNTRRPVMRVVTHRRKQRDLSRNVGFIPRPRAAATRAGTRGRTAR